MLLPHLIGLRMKFASRRAAAQLSLGGVWEAEIGVTGFGALASQERKPQATTAWRRPAPRIGSPAAGPPPGLGGLSARGHRGGARAPSQPELGLEVDRLLCGLQRGTVPGADASVNFLCQKFTTLTERLRNAEAVEQERREHCAVLEAEIRCASAAAEAERVEQESAAARANREILAVGSALGEARQQEQQAEDELCRARARHEALRRRRDGLTEESVGECARLADASGRLRQLQRARPCEHDELKRDHVRLEAMASRYATMSAELQSCRERIAGSEQRLHTCRSEARSEDEARQQATEESVTQREELREVSGHVAALSEHLAEAQANVQLREDQIARHLDSKQALWRELQRREAWLVANTPKAEGYQAVECCLERMLADAAEVRSMHLVEEAEERQAEACNATRGKSLADSELKCMERSHRLEELEAAHEASLVPELREAEHEERQLQVASEDLRRDRAAGGGVRQNLEDELRFLAEEMVGLKSERDKQVVGAGELRQRLALVTPALADSRRGLRDLENKSAEAQKAAAKDQQLHERLEREMGASQEKTRGLRDENVRLSEQCTDFEAQLASDAASRSAARGDVRRNAALGTTARRSRSSGPSPAVGSSQRGCSSGASAPAAVAAWLRHSLQGLGDREDGPPLERDHSPGHSSAPSSWCGAYGAPDAIPYAPCRRSGSAHGLGLRSVVVPPASAEMPTWAFRTPSADSARGHQPYLAVSASRSASALPPTRPAALALSEPVAVRGCGIEEAEGMCGELGEWVQDAASTRGRTGRCASPMLLEREERSLEWSHGMGLNVQQSPRSLGSLQGWIQPEDLQRPSSMPG